MTTYNFFARVLRGGGQRILGLTVLLLVPLFVHSQSAFFVEKTFSQAHFSAQDSAHYDWLQDTSFSTAVWIVSTADVRSLQQDGVLSFVMPGATDTLLADAIRITDDSLHGFIWSGQLLNDAGYVSFHYKDGKTFGFITKSDGFYDLIPATGGLQFLVRRSQGGDAGCGIPPELDSLSDITIEPADKCQYEPDYNTCPAVISVLIIATPQAATYVNDNLGGLANFVQHCEEQANMAFQNSDIPNKSIRIEFIEKSGFVFHEEEDIRLDLEELVTWSVSERAQYKADLVFLLCDTYHPTIGGVAFPVPFASEELGFAIFEAKRNDEAGIFVHELGHTFGCRHNWTRDLGDDDTKICAHGYAHFALSPPSPLEPSGTHGTANVYRTIVTVPFPPVFGLHDNINNIDYDVTSKGWILHYSNPDVAYSNFQTGRATAHITDNAQQIRNIGCDIAGYIPTQELAAFPSFSPQGCHPNSSVTFSANIVEPEEELPGTAPYTVTWFWNTSGYFNAGNTNAQSMGTGSVLNLLEHPSCPRYWVKCVIQSSDGVIINRIFRVVLGGLDCDCPAPISTEDHSNGFPFLKPSSALSPNPVEAGRSVSLPSGTIWYSLSDVNGKTIQSETLGEGTFLKVPSQTPAGLYFVQVRLDNTETKTYKLFILQSK